MRYFHVDVFAESPLKGNPLAVVLPEKDLSSAQMLSIAKEFNLFETVFVRESGGEFALRIFTVDEELPFAGHPLLGAGAVIHSHFFGGRPGAEIPVRLGKRRVELVSEKKGDHYSVIMNQGEPSYIGTVPEDARAALARFFSLSPDDLDSRYPAEVISTGLPYLILPVRRGLERASIAEDGLEPFIAFFGARFVYLADLKKLECRTWDNRGHAEDIATGSAAGPLYHYLERVGLAAAHETVTLRQGRFLGRPSIIEAWSSDEEGRHEVFIKGNVSFFSEGNIVAE